MCASKRFSCPSLFHPSTNRRMYKLLSNGLITPRTRKAISNLKDWLWGGEKGTHCLICVVNSNTVMSNNRSTKMEKARQLNAARGLLQRQIELPEAVRRLSREFDLSERQAYPPMRLVSLQ